MSTETFKSMKTGKTAQVEMPLHPTLLRLEHDDGSSSQVFRGDFDQEYVRQVNIATPELPKVDPKTIPQMTVVPGTKGPIATPSPGQDANQDLASLRAFVDDVAGKLTAEAHATRDAVDRIESKLDQIGRVLEGIARAPGDVHRVGELVSQLHTKVDNLPQKQG
jgi:hypothetical protein